MNRNDSIVVALLLQIRDLLAELAGVDPDEFENISDQDFRGDDLEENAVAPTDAS